MMRARIAGAVAGAVVGLITATQMFAWTYGFDPVLGPAWRPAPDLLIYPPWAILSWRSRFGDQASAAFGRAGLIVLLGGVGGLGLGAVLTQTAGLPRIRGWGSLQDARDAGLLRNGGAILGLFKGRLLATEDMRPTLVTGGTRSGKGRGHVAPTLLAWPASVLVHDPKGELWTLSSGWRSRFSHALWLAPRRYDTARWNPLAEIHPGPGELAQVQRLVAILADPNGSRNEDTIWDTAASEIVEAVILHVLYTADDAHKTLLEVRDLLADLDETAETMRRTLHKVGPDGPQVHPFIKTAVHGYAGMHDRFRTSVQGTARSYLKWLAGDDVERALSRSDFSMADLMCAPSPVSLYIQVSPADAAALKPLVRLLFYAAAQSLTAEVSADARGRPKRHKLLMVMDEFPMLGRLAFFEKSLRLMSGYGIKAMLVAQSLNDIVETYGPHNTILDNCFVYTSFSTLDPLTQDKASRLTGMVSETRVTRSGPAFLGGGRHSVSRGEIERPLLEPGEIRALGHDQQLTFVAGHKPLRTRKLQYDRHPPFRRRAHDAPPDQSGCIDAPPSAPHPWAGRRNLGKIEADDAFTSAAAVADKAHVAAIYGRMAQEMAAQDRGFSALEGSSDD